jgi:hypothetical protein
VNHSLCFQQGLAAQVMASRTVSLCYGAALENWNGLSAHVWILQRGCQPRQAVRYLPTLSYWQVDRGRVTSFLAIPHYSHVLAAGLATFIGL